MNKLSKLSHLSLLAALLGGTLAGPVLAGVEAPSGETPLMTAAAHGVQIYECRAPSAAEAGAKAVPAWAFVAPEADLFDADGRRIGTHGAGPVWQHQDGSRFTGTVSARQDSPSGAIPWLLLAARKEGPEGTFSRVSNVQRLNTVGGQPPADGCSTATLGKRVHMAYRADYVLLVPRP